MHKIHASSRVVLRRTTRVSHWWTLSFYRSLFLSVLFLTLSLSVDLFYYSPLESRNYREYHR